MKRFCVTLTTFASKFGQGMHTWRYGPSLRPCHPLLQTKPSRMAAAGFELKGAKYVNLMSTPPLQCTLTLLCLHLHCLGCATVLIPFFRDHPICPVMLYDAKLATEFADEMLKRGVYVIGFSYPVRTPPTHGFSACTNATILLHHWALVPLVLCRWCHKARHAFGCSCPQRTASSRWMPPSTPLLKSAVLSMSFRDESTGFD